MERTVTYRRLPPILVLMGGLCTGCAGHIWWPGALADFRVTSRGQDSAGDSCRDFSLTAAQARWFFGRARATQEHDCLADLPCWVRGTARGMDGTWQWEIRADGSARLVAPDGAVQLLGCSNCKAVLGLREAPQRP
jgi:hypothetical protein